MNKLIYGFHSITTYIKNHPTNIEMIYLDTNRQDKRLHELITLAETNNIKLNKINNHELDTLTKIKTHQGVAAKVKILTKPSLQDLLISLNNKSNAQVLILDGITDPQNLGAIIRTAECFGVDAIILPRNNSANADNATVAKVSSGAVDNITIIIVNNLNQAIDTLKQYEFWIAGTSLKDTSINLFDFKFQGKLAWVMGSEGNGIRHLVEENCDYLITIPLSGNTQSLNVSVATGIILAYTNFMQTKE